MNHATWSLGTTSSTSWRKSSPRHPRRQSQTGSSSTHGEKKKTEKSKDLTHENPAESRHCKSQEEIEPTQSDQCENTHQHHKNGHRSTPATPHSSAVRKKSTSLSTEEGDMSKSPSVPNLRATATSMLALQGSLTAFTAMAVGKDLPKKTKQKKNAKQPQGNNCTVVVTNYEENEGKENFDRASTPKSPVSSYPPCTCHQRALSPEPRLNMHTHVPEEKSSHQDINEETWIEHRSANPEPSALLLNKTFPKNLPYKETSV